MARMMPRLMTQAEVARFLHVSVSTVRVWRCRLQGPVFIRVGRHVRYREADLHAWVAEMANKPKKKREAA
jgi:hypothetical protein